MALLLVPAAAGAGSKCLSREGQCTAVTVNGQPSVKLGKKTKKLLRDLKHISHYVADVRYELATPIKGVLDVRADRAPSSRDWFGPVREVDVIVVPLGTVDLQTHQELTTADDVRIGGAAAVGVQHVLEDSRLPAGQYLLVVRLQGEANWDRQVLFFEAQGE